MTGEFAVAVHAMVYLNHKKETLSSETLATNVCTNSARIRKVMAKLKKGGLVMTKEGIAGGYYFDKEPDQVNLRQISDALEARIVESTWKSGNKDMDCLIASGMANILDGICFKLDEACRDRLEQITIQDIDHAIFKEGGKVGCGKA